MKINELAQQAGVTRDTIRHYLAIGLLTAARNPSNGYQVFDDGALSRLQFIRAARQLGLTLEDVRQIFADAENAHSPCPRVRELLVRRIAETRDSIAELTLLCDRMERTVDQWRQMPDSMPDGTSVCRLIESQQQQLSDNNGETVTP